LGVGANLGEALHIAPIGNTSQLHSPVTVVVAKLE